MIATAKKAYPFAGNAAHAIKGEPRQGLVAVLSNRASFVRRINSVMHRGDRIYAAVSDFNDFKSFILKYKPAVAVIDTSTVPGAEVIPGILRLRSCHVPFIASTRNRAMDEDRLYDLGFSAVIDRFDGRKKTAEIIYNFI